MSFFAELKRRNVLRAAALYIGAAWALSQGVAQLLPVFDFPNWVIRWFVIAAMIGFPFAMLFSWFYEWTPQGIVRESEVAPEASIKRETGRKMDRWIFAVMAVAIVLLLADIFVPHKDMPSTDTSAASDQSIAVLPLVNESGDKDQQYFSDGLSEDLINTLSQFDGLKVIGRTSSFQFRDSKNDARTIGGKLGVATLLEGTVERAGDMVRINATLVSVADGRTLWSDRYDRPYKDLFALQDEITRSVAGALASKLLPGKHAAAQTNRPPSGNLDAYAAYLRGQSGYARATEQSLRQAIDDYSTATRLDPHYAAAYAGLSMAWQLLAGRFLDYDQTRQANAKARVAADAALAAAPELAAGHRARAELLLEADFDWNDAAAGFRRALELAPNDAEIKIAFASMQAALGHTAHAVDLVRQALPANPRDSTSWLYLSRYLAQLGRLEEAAQAIRRAIELQPDAASLYQQLTAVEVLRGDANAALAAAQQEPPGIWRDIAMAQALQIGTDKAAADAALKTLIDKRAQFSEYQIAEVQALRKDPDQMFAWLDRAWTDRDSGLEFLLYDPFILRYRDDPRFTAFCRKVGLPTPAEAAASKATASSGINASSAAPASGRP